ncbi:MAG: biopolymer transporter ExbD, partial [Pseudomonadota bacterium]
IELTPLIDVVFLLLIFFMISTTFTKETTLKINLPEADGASAPVEPFSLEVQVGSESQYAIQSSEEPAARALVDSQRDTLYRALSEFAERDNILMIIRADKSATHEAVIRVLDVAQQLEMTNITFATKQSATGD